MYLFELEFLLQSVILKDRLTDYLSFGIKQSKVLVRACSTEGAGEDGIENSLSAQALPGSGRGER